MTEAALSLQFTQASVETGPQLRLTLEPDTEGRGTVTPGFAAIEAMLGRAQSGLSARTVQREHCPCVTITADGQLVLRLAVLVWPSRPELAYSLSLPAEARPGGASPPEPALEILDWRQSPALPALDAGASPDFLAAGFCLCGRVFQAHSRGAPVARATRATPVLPR